MYNILNVFSRLLTNNAAVPSRNISINTPLYFNVTSALLAEPLKKKKRVDPTIIRAREERKRKKLEKSIRRMQKHARQLKPISETEISISLKNELQIRKRDLPTLSAETLEARAELFKEWSRYKTEQHKETVKLINGYISGQEKALKELKAESETLYLGAIQIDPDLLPYSTKGPTETAPIENFDPPDGEYIDITKKFEGEET